MADFVAALLIVGGLAVAVAMVGMWIESNRKERTRRAIARVLEAGC